MQLVIDTSAVIAVIVNEAEKPALVKATAGVELVAPASLHWEIGNAFSAMLKRKRIDVANAGGAVAAYRQIPIRFVDVALEEAIEIAAEYGLYAYDAYFIVCARALRCDLLTLDRGLAHAASRAGINITELST